MTSYLAIAAFLCLALLAEVIGTVGGFGSSTFFVPIAQLFFPFKLVLAITALFHVASNSAKLALFWKHIDHKLAVLIGIPSVAFVVFGAYLTRIVPSQQAQLILGIFLIAFAAFFLVKPMKFKPSTGGAMVGGGIAGFTAGMLGTGGAIRGATLVAFDLKKEVFVATSAAIDFAVDLSRSIVYVEGGYLTPQHYAYIPALFAVAFVGSYIGKLILNRVSQERFRVLVLVLILVVGGVLIGQALMRR